MLKKHAQFFENILFFADLFVIGFSWFISYYIRFYSGLLPIEKGIPPFIIYLYLIIPILFIWSFVFKSFGLYRPKRISSYISELFDIVKACSFSVLVLISITFFFRQYEYSRLLFLIFFLMTVSALAIERVAFRETLRYLRRKGYNLRYALIAGTGELAKDVLKRIELHPELGLKVAGFLSNPESQTTNSEVHGVPVIGAYRDIQKIVSEKDIDQVIIALPVEQHALTVELLKEIRNEMVDIKVVPDICEFITLRGGIDELDGLPIISLQDTPLYGWNIVIKRGADILFSIAILIASSPLMILTALLIKITSAGSIFYKQERMGMDGTKFFVYKFRTMIANAEERTGPVWAKEGDVRRTDVGAFLRRTNLDELPQLFNVLKGNMSIVGPRPERPVFVEQFRKSIPQYMLRHKMKAGITGWAQVNGWRGNTSIEKRIEYDLYYIENWSLMFDIKIILMTMWKGFKNAY
ncbi:MAG TPA: undecaprenyl-phosphate glucose phosphotransferase [Nitrospinae bacterium]|nr:undecaprenyl-phosphate glucose phosphotransferase [Nitrospinota bacterium]HBA26279.1 undecaprenyl-phosphate glucose phosphotransferase [Nitrospinota bacterium]